MLLSIAVESARLHNIPVFRDLLVPGEDHAMVTDGVLSVIYVSPAIIKDKAAEIINSYLRHSTTYAHPLSKVSLRYSQ